MPSQRPSLGGLALRAVGAKSNCGIKLARPWSFGRDLHDHLAGKRQNARFAMQGGCALAKAGWLDKLATCLTMEACKVRNHAGLQCPRINSKLAKSPAMKT